MSCNVKVISVAIVFSTRCAICCLTAIFSLIYHFRGFLIAELSQERGKGNIGPNMFIVKATDNLA